MTRSIRLIIAAEYAYLRYVEHGSRWWLDRWQSLVAMQIQDSRQKLSHLERLAS